MRGLRLWLRWSWRDIRSRWVQVAAIALVIALGTGTYAGLGSTARWRKSSADASYAVLEFHDLEVTLGEGSLTPQGTLAAALAGLPSGVVGSAEERLRVPTQVDASTAEHAILVPGVVIGVPLDAGQEGIDKLQATGGRGLEAMDQGSPVVVLEQNFADYYHLAPQGRLAVSGQRQLQYVGTAASAEYFIVVPDDGAGFLMQANFAALFTSLATAQQMVDMPQAVNDMVIRLLPGNDPETAAAQVQEALEAALPGLGVEVTTRADDPSYTVMYEDIENDQQTFSVFAMLIFIGAIAAAFNLTTRLVEAQRREIGIAMALGVPGRRIATRPLLVALQIALLGAVLGVLVGLGLAVLMRGVLEGFFPLPIWITSFQISTFARGAMVGLAVPFAASLYPVWRATRVAPIEAIRTSHLARRVQLRWPGRRSGTGNTFRRLPVRNLMRAPRRTILTGLGIAAVIAVAFALAGMIDSFLRTVEVGEGEILGHTPDRIMVDLDRPYPTGSGEVRAVLEAAQVGEAEASLDLPGSLASGQGTVDALLSVVDLRHSRWVPTLLEGALPESGGILISRKAADDLGVAPGDSLLLRHPVRVGPFSVGMKESELTVTGIHAVPYRFTVFMDQSQVGITGFAGFSNRASVTPGPGYAENDVKRALFDLESVASVQPASAVADAFRDLLGRFVGILQVVQLAVFALAAAIAFNSASLNLEERRRDHATMFAFGVPVRKAVGMAVAEGALLGLGATLLGVGAGYGLLRWFVTSVFAETAPDIGVLIWMAPRSLAIVAALGVLAVGAAPLLTARRMRTMNIPGTLRVME